MEVKQRNGVFTPMGEEAKEPIFYGYIVKVLEEDKKHYYFFNSLEEIPFSETFEAEMLYKIEDEHIKKRLALGNMRLFMLLYGLLENKEDIFLCGWHLEHKKYDVVKRWIDDGVFSVQDIYDKNNLIYFYRVQDLMDAVRWSEEEKADIRKALANDDVEVLNSYGLCIAKNRQRIYKRNPQGGLSKEKVQALKKEWNWRHCDTDEEKCENCKYFVNREFEGHGYKRCGRLSWHFGCFSARTDLHKVCDMWETKE